MIETICQNCGNRKSFEEEYAGRTYKCPSCASPVIIENLGAQIVNESTSKTTSLTEEIDRAQSVKAEKERIQAEEEYINKINEKKLGAGCLAFTFLSAGMVTLYTGFFRPNLTTEDHFEIILIALIPFGAGIYYFRKWRNLNKHKNNL